LIAIAVGPTPIRVYLTMQQPFAGKEGCSISATYRTEKKGMKNGKEE
jgi:hypothetical protein